MQYFILFAIVSIVLALAASPVAAYTSKYSKEAETPHSEVMPDIPLMQGLEEAAPQADPKNPEQLATPNQTTFTGGGNDKQARSYYDAALRAQGWKLADPAMRDVYVNDAGDRMEMAIFFNGTTTVTFRRTPAATTQETPAEGEQNVTPRPDGE